MFILFDEDAKEFIKDSLTLYATNKNKSVPEVIEELLELMPSAYEEEFSKYSKAAKAFMTLAMQCYGFGMYNIYYYQDDNIVCVYAYFDDISVNNIKYMHYVKKVFGINLILCNRHVIAKVGNNGASFYTYGVGLLDYANTTTDSVWKVAPDTSCMSHETEHELIKLPATQEETLSLIVDKVKHAVQNSTEMERVSINAILDTFMKYKMDMEYVSTLFEVDSNVTYWVGISVPNSFTEFSEAQLVDLKRIVNSMYAYIGKADPYYMTSYYTWLKIGESLIPVKPTVVKAGLQEYLRRGYKQISNEDLLAVKETCWFVEAPTLAIQAAIDESYREGIYKIPDRFDRLNTYTDIDDIISEINNKLKDNTGAYNSEDAIPVYQVIVCRKYNNDFGFTIQFSVMPGVTSITNVMLNELRELINLSNTIVPKLTFDSFLEFSRLGIDYEKCDIESMCNKMHVEKFLNLLSVAVH